ncbi:MAG: hypothetical protein ACLGG7_04415 [Bacteriovoracia bacterium]
MDKKLAKGKTPYESETSIFAHPNQMPKANQLVMPTWALIVVLIASFFILKGFIYLKDEKRHGK